MRSGPKTDMLSSRKGGTSKARWEALLTKYEKYIVAGIFILALVLRLFHLQQIKSHDPFFALPSVDPRVYHAWAVEISEGNWLGTEVFFNSPLYPYFLAVIYKIFGQSFFVAKLIQFLMGSFSCLLIYLLAKRIFNPKVGLVAGVMAALYVMSLFYEGILLITNIQTPLNLLLILMLLHSFESPVRRNWLFSGICLGLSALARPNILLFGPFVLFWIFYTFKDRMSRKQILHFGLFFCMGIGLLIFPVTLRNYVVGKDIVLISSQGGINFYIGNNPNAKGYFMVPKVLPRTKGDDPIEQRRNFEVYAEQKVGRALKPSEVSRYWFSQGMKFIKEQPGRWIGLLLRKCGLLVNHYEIWNNRSYYFSRQFSWVLRLPLLTFGIVAPLALFGILLTLKDWKRLFLLYAIIGSYAASLVIFFMLSRYRMVVVPFLIILAAYALHWFFESLRAKKFQKAATALVPLAFFFLMVNQNLVNQGSSMVHYNLGNKYMKMRKWEMAIEQYERSIQQNPTYISAHNNLALVFEKRPEWYDKGIREWKIVLKMAEERRDQGYIDRALRHLRKLRQLKSRDQPR